MVDRMPIRASMTGISFAPAWRRVSRISSLDRSEASRPARAMREIGESISLQRSSAALSCFTCKRS